MAQVLSHVKTVNRLTVIGLCSSNGRYGSYPLSNAVILRIMD